MAALQKNYKKIRSINKRILCIVEKMIFQLQLEVNRKGIKGGNSDLILMPEDEEQEEVLATQEYFGPDKRPDHREVGHQEIEFHPKPRILLEAREEHQAEKLSEELKLELMKVLKTAIIGLVTTRIKVFKDIHKYPYIEHLVTLKFR